jgi:hypothetical protein
MAHKKWLYPIEIKELFHTYLRIGIIYWTLAFLAVLRWLTQQALQDWKIITQFGRFLAGRL